MKEISIKDIENIKIGNAENKKAATGCTVILCEKIRRKNNRTECIDEADDKEGWLEF